MRNGELYEHPTWALPTDENGYSSLLPTPVVNDMGDGKTPEWWAAWTARQKALTGNGNGHGKSLAIETALLPTPQAHDQHGGKTPEQVESMRQRTGAGVSNLNEIIPAMFPTPTSRDHKGRNQRDDATCLPGAVNLLLPTPKATNNENASSAWANGPNLGEAIQMLPTPRTSDANGGGGITVTADLIYAPLLPIPQARDHKGIPGDRFNMASLPRSIGRLTSRPSADGSDSPDQHPDPSTTEDDSTRDSWSG